MNILSPMATGNGAYVIHNALAEKIADYHICGYNPYWTLFPPALPFCCHNRQSTEIIHTTPDYACFFTKKNTPLVITFHNFVLDKFMGNYSSVPQQIHYKTDLRIFTRRSIAVASAITSVSKFTANLVKKELGFSGELKVIHNGIDTNLFRPTKKVSTNKVKVLFSGNLTRRKGADLLPLIAEELDDNIEIIYTRGLRTKNKLPPLPNLTNIGKVRFCDMPKVYQQADILLFPTVREGFGLAAAEAMSCGLPVVTTNCSSLPELIVQGKGGYLCTLGNVKEFAARINELAVSPELRRDMGEFNRERVEEKFTIERMIRDYTQLFESVLACHSV